MSIVLVTGANGFLGRHVALVCSLAGHKVYGLGHGQWKPMEREEWGVSVWFSADITIDSLQSLGCKPDVIIHCAGSGSVSFSLSNPSDDFLRTVLTTKSVLEYVRRFTRDTRVILPSSASVYGDAKQIPISVSAPLCPISPYGVHKQMAEELCISYSNHFHVNIKIVRLFSIYGIGLRKQLFWDACLKLSRGPSVFGGTGHESRDWLHVEDAARLLLLAGLDTDSNQITINGATGIGVPTRQVVNSIAREFGGTNMVSFSGCTRPGDPVHLIADIQGSKHLNWAPSHNLEQEIVRYVEWFNRINS